MAKVIAVLNQKGGVGKSTTVINLGAYLAKNGYRVLVVDTDPQGNSTSGLGLDKKALDATLYDVLFSRADAPRTIKKATSHKLSVLPANEQLAGAEVEMVSAPAREFKLKGVLDNLPHNHDYILIDCPPSLGLLSVNALAAAEHVLIPVQAEYYALEGLSQLLSVVQQVRSAVNPNLNVLGVVLTMYDSRNSLSEQVHKELNDYFGDKMFETVIPRNVRLAEAPSFGRTIAEHDKWSKGARAYKNLAKEFERKING
ncbi:MAG TPA: ParA family protein [Candidatus Saccharimonadales bacterium]|nr:ParA family protein [Candidatus Saccharimonadales bacterium]